MTVRHAAPANDLWALILRLFAWGTTTLTLAFLFEAWAIHWMGQPSLRAGGLWAGAGYGAAVAAAMAMAGLGQRTTLRADSDRLAWLAGLIARWAFWAILMIGLVDAALSFLRIEGLLAGLVGDDLNTRLGQAAFRGPNVHMILAAVAIPLALLTRGVPFIWLALLVVAIQLGMVIGRFVFSYEQAFLADMVRTYYSALFLFASAWTLAEEGHVRVDVFYAAMSRRGKALVNGLGSVLLGMTMMWTILILGTQTSASTIVGPILRYETGQTGTGMMTKYWLAAFLGIFAVTMMIQFASYVLKSAADWRDEHDPRSAPEAVAMLQPKHG
jgi:TRAP-type mannitol/chloroaromatic compound transport system permease small subunit